MSTAWMAAVRRGVIVPHKAMTCILLFVLWRDRIHAVNVEGSRVSNMHLGASGMPAGGEGVAHCWQRQCKLLKILSL